MLADTPVTMVAHRCPAARTVIVNTPPETAEDDTPATGVRHEACGDNGRARHPAGICADIPPTGTAADNTP
ncbi:hypothetical protein GCM10009743_00630 [Kribbella swartbergensis]